MALPNFSTVFPEFSNGKGSLGVPMTLWYKGSSVKTFGDLNYEKLPFPCRSCDGFPGLCI